MLTGKTALWNPSRFDRKLTAHAVLDNSSIAGTSGTSTEPVDLFATHGSMASVQSTLRSSMALPGTGEHKEENSLNRTREFLAYQKQKEDAEKEPEIKIRANGLEDPLAHNRPPLQAMIREADSGLGQGMLKQRGDKTSAKGKANQSGIKLGFDDGAEADRFNTTANSSFGVTDDEAVWAAAGQQQAAKDRMLFFRGSRIALGHNPQSWSTSNHMPDPNGMTRKADAGLQGTEPDQKPRDLRKTNFMLGSDDRDWETTTGNGHFKLDHGAAAGVIAETKQAATEMAANARAVHLTLGYDADPMQSEAGGAFQDFGKDALAGKASAPRRNEMVLGYEGGDWSTTQGDCEDGIRKFHETKGAGGPKGLQSDQHSIPCASLTVTARLNPPSETAGPGRRPRNMQAPLDRRTLEKFAVVAKPDGDNERASDKEINLAMRRTNMKLGDGTEDWQTIAGRSFGGRPGGRTRNKW